MPTNNSFQFVPSTNIIYISRYRETCQQRHSHQHCFAIYREFIHALLNTCGRYLRTLTESICMQNRAKSGHSAGVMRQM